MMAAANASDGELVRAACAGQAAAVAALIDRHWPLVHKLLARAIGNWTEAEDLAQETMFQAVRRLAELREPERFRPWLYTIALNRARLWWRRAPARRFTQSLDTLLVERPVAVERHLAGDGASAEAAWEASDLARAIGRAISALPQKQHRAIVAHYVEGLTYGEIAALLGVPASTIRGRLHHARGRLRRELAQLTSEGYAEFDRPPYAPSGRKRPRRLAMTYVEMIVDSVRMDSHGTSRSVVLKEPESDHMLPITIGRAEAEAIIFKLQELPIPRPMSHDLMVSLATAFGAAIQEVRVTKWEQETFFAAVVVARDGQTEEIDARASDAIALALRAQVPIYVHTAVREKAKALVKPTSATPNSTTQVLVMSDQPRRDDAVWTRESVQLVERAVGAAERLGSTHLGTEHILLALTEVADAEPESDLAKLFQALELDLVGVREALESAAADASPIEVHLPAAGAGGGNQGRARGFTAARS